MPLKDRKKRAMYYIWYDMKKRCLNPNNKAYPYYGGRGIMICERWMVFENFLADMGMRPEGMTLDRKDNDGHYEPSNCKWSTPLEQQNNRGYIKDTTPKKATRKWSKLKDKEVWLIKKLLGKIDQRTIAKMFRVSQRAITKINRGYTFKNV